MKWLGEAVSIAVIVVVLIVTTHYTDRRAFRAGVDGCLAAFEAIAKEEVKP